MLTEPASYIHARNNTQRKELTDKALTKLFCCAGWSVTIVVRCFVSWGTVLECISKAQ